MEDGSPAVATSSSSFSLPLYLYSSLSVKLGIQLLISKLFIIVICKEKKTNPNLFLASVSYTCRYDL
jgi:hypothetical protein